MKFAGPKLLQKMVEFVVATQLNLPHNDNDGYYYALGIISLFLFFSILFLSCY